MRILIFLAAVFALAGCASSGVQEKPMNPQVEWRLDSDQEWDKITIILEKDGEKHKETQTNK